MSDANPTTLESSARPGRRARRLWALGALCAVAMLVVGGYTARAVRRGTEAVSTLEGGGFLPLAAPPDRPYLIVSSTLPDDTFKKLLVAPLSAPAGSAYVGPLACERVYFAGNRGICLIEEGALIRRRYALVFDEQFKPLQRIPLTGVVSRTRVSADGRRAAITVFEQGHSYAEDGFSTRTTLIDASEGRVLTDLEQFTIWRDGKRFHAADFNFWGVTFARDGNRFYATLASKGIKYLVEGDVDKRQGRVLRMGVECPSLSPDNMRIVYKNMIRREGFWELRVLDLATEVDHALSAETRSVDDQVDWLDNDHVLYHITGARGADIWVLRSDGTKPPAILRQYAYSPAVVR